MLLTGKPREQIPKKPGQTAHLDTFRMLSPGCCKGFLVCGWEFGLGEDDAGLGQGPHFDMVFAQDPGRRQRLTRRVSVGA